jgi:TRAP-type mannitol/chloroaromatic compound transport system substrate-binding protein
VKKKVLMVLIGLGLVLSLVFSFLPSCGGGEPTPGATTPGATTPGATTPGATTPGPAPTGQGEVFNWRLQSTSTAGTSTYWIDEMVVDNIKTCSNGRMNLDLLPSGSIVGTMEVFDAVSQGAVEVGTSCDCYWAGNDPLFDIVGMIGAHFTYEEGICWFYGTRPDEWGGNNAEDKEIATGGMKEIEDLFANFNIKYIFRDIGSPEAEYVSNKMIVEPGDYKGLQFRGTGWTGKVMNSPEFGAAGVMMPPGDVYSSLERGILDACELGNPSSNWNRGLHEVTDYTGFPGIHKITETHGLLINMDSWNTLPPDIQKIIEVCVNDTCAWRYAYDTTRSAYIIPQLIDYGNTIVRESSALQRLWKETSWRLARELNPDDTEFQAVIDRHLEHMDLIGGYLKLQAPDYGNDPGGPIEKWPLD